MMNKEQLNAIKERVAKATPGEWFYDSYTVCTDEIFDGDGGLIETVTIDYADRHGDVHSKEETDAQFVAHARQDVPALIAEVERLREALLLIQNSDTWLIEPSPMMHTIEEVYHACVDIADKTLGGAQK